MGVNGCKRVFNSPFYVNFKKHYCPNCGVRVKKIKVSRVVNSASSEAKDFDFHMMNTYMIGNVKFIWTEFQCPNCRRQFSIEDMKRIEEKKE